jgi:hypothetical protein
MLPIYYTCTVFSVNSECDWSIPNFHICLNLMVTLWLACAGTEERQRYSTNPFTVSVLEGRAWSLPCPKCFTPWKIWYPFYRRLGGLQDRAGQVQKIFPPPRLDPWTIQPVASRWSYLCLSCLLFILAEFQESQRVNVLWNVAEGIAGCCVDVLW